MQAKILVGAALFSALSTAQINNIATAEAARGATDQASYYSALATNTAFSNDLVAVANAIPTSILSQISANPASFANVLNTATTVPAWVSAIPTPVLNSLNLLLAPQNQVDNDVDAIATAPAASAVFANPGIPTTVQQAFTSDPVGFIENLLTATTWPAWATSIPGPLQTQVGNVINQELSTIVDDYEASYTLSSSTTPTGAFYSTHPTRHSSGFAGPTSGRPFFPTASGSCPPPVTVLVTVTAIPTAGQKSSTKPTANTVPAVPVASTPTRASSGFAKSSGLPQKSGTASSSIVAFTGTKTGAPLAFTGAAAPMRTAAVGAALFVAGAGALLNV